MLKISGGFPDIILNKAFKVTQICVKYKYWKMITFIILERRTSNSVIAAETTSFHFKEETT